MTEVKIHYQISPESHDQGDTEKIITAMGAYQQELPFPADHHHEAIIQGHDTEGVLLKLVRTIRTDESYDQLQQLKRQ